MTHAAIDTTSTHSTDFVIIGAGPVGLTLALDLAQRGARVQIIEQRRAGEPPSVKCNHVAARSMEIFRRLGIVEQIRNAGLPPDFPHDIVYRTTFVGPDLTRIPIPPRAERYTTTEGPDAWWPTPEGPHRINQIYLEPLLFAAAVASPNITIHAETTYTEMAQDADGVSVQATRADGSPLALRAQYLVGCDGGRSLVRHQIGARLQGDAVVQRVQSTYIRCPQLLGLQPTRHAWGNISMNPRRSGTVYAIDGRETWLIHNYLKDDEADFDSVDRDWAIRAILGIDESVPYEVINREDWFGRRLVADKVREGRVFICGDAAHLWVPYAGYGMNAGIADAEQLAWTLAGTLQGWGGPALLDAHTRERLPITAQVSHFAMDHAHAMAKQRRAVPAEIEDDTPYGAAARERVGQAAYDLNVQQYAAAGLNFGYYYDDSPLIAYDGAQHPPYSMGFFTPSTVPGCRMPHIWLRDGHSLYDAAGRDYCLLLVDAQGPAVAQPLIAAAAMRGVPLSVLAVETDDELPEDAPGMILMRPDRHIAWRGDALPDDCLALIDRVRGARVD